MPQRPVSLDDKYTLAEGAVFMTGLQALVRVALEQSRRDRAAGARTAGFVSGYRGSPLGRYDLELWRAQKHLEAHDIRFQPGVNEDLAASAVWGSQFVGSFPGARFDGVFGIWYGKGPGVDRSGDPLRHGNLAGSSRLGGVIVLAGDDHMARSSTTAHQTDYMLIGSALPILYPASVQEILEFGLHGIAMSRHSGCWVSLKLVTEIVESAGTVLVGPQRPAVRMPEALRESPHIRGIDGALQREARLHQLKLPAVLGYARVNSLNRIEELGAPGCAPRFGILTAGKSYADTRQALQRLGPHAAQSIRVAKAAMVWPLEPEFATAFAAGLETILVVEEKRPLLEDQLKTILYDAALPAKPRIVGKFDGATPLLPAVADLSPEQIARVLARLLGMPLPCESGSKHSAVPARKPHFCSGCPHGTSTQVPSGSRALGGIGCHGMASSAHPEITTTMSHMGGEGVLWVGQAPFTDEKHVFANMGDGTYYHSGLLAIRQAIAAKVNITFKLLVNGFVSMTGGQPIEGDLSVPRIVQELKAEGVGRIVVVTDEPSKYGAHALEPDTPVRHRRELERTQKELREQPGVSVLIYDQLCATERRRLRKRGALPEPAKRSFIHPAVCEGCGDCGVKSDCLSIEPLETELGRKRRINQSTCNKDFSCVEGFCPSFVTVHGGKLRARASGKAAPADLPAPILPVLKEPFGLLVAGIGGTGVVTAGAILTMAAHLEGKAASSLDITGLAQKYGSVMSHVRIARSSSELFSTRLAEGEADLVLGSDLIVTAGDESLSRFRLGRTHALVNAAIVPTGDFTGDPDWAPDVRSLRERISAAGGEGVRFIDAAGIAAALLGDSIAANSFLLGVAWQQGRIPVSLESLQRAIELNGVAVEMNRASFAWGRAYALDAEAVERLAAPAARSAPGAEAPLDELIAHRAKLLAEYQSDAHAGRYRKLVARLAETERSVASSEELARAAALGYYKLLAHKDEFEVARLLCHPDFKALLEETFEGPYSLRFHLGGGPFAKKDRSSGRVAKTEVGPWIMPAFRLLASVRTLRGTWLDPWRRTPERRLGAHLLKDYESDLTRIVQSLTAANHGTAVKLASLPEKIRGYGHVREASASATAKEREQLLARLATT